MNAQVKICGIRTLESALGAVEAGADFLGFNFVPDSRRFISFQRAAEIAVAVNGRARIVGVFRDARPSFIAEAANALRLDFVQLHGRESPEYLAALSLPVIKAIHSPDQISLYSPDYFLLDRTSQGEGPMVQTEDARAAALLRPIFLAGGLTPENVSGVLRKVRPFAVDVAGGIESRGVPDVRKIRKFVTNAKKVFL